MLWRKGCEFTVRVSFLEIYNEELIDLLGADSVENPRLKIYEDNLRKVVCRHCTSSLLQNRHISNSFTSLCVGNTENDLEYDLMHQLCNVTASYDSHLLNNELELQAHCCVSRCLVFFSLI